MPAEGCAGAQPDGESSPFVSGAQIMKQNVAGTPILRLTATTEL